MTAVTPCDDSCVTRISHESHFSQDRSFKDTKSSVKSQFSQVIDQGRSSVK